MYERSSDLSQKRKSSRGMENERIRILHVRQKEQILAEVRSEIQKHELQADSDRRSIQELTEIIDSQELSEQNRALRDLEELQKSHVLKVEELSRIK